MSEQEQETEKKKTSIVKRVLKWIVLGLLTLLLVAAIIFQTPWKITTLLLIILLACTALPRPVRKWFWLAVAVVVVVLIIWVFLPDDNEGWRPYTFDEELAAIEAKRAIPDSENAAIIYNQLLANYDANTFEPNFLDPNLEDLIRKEPWSSRDYPEFAQWIKQHEGTITKLIEASKIEKCRFPVVADMMAFGEHMKILAPMGRWAFLLIRAANNDLGDGRIDKAIEKQIAVLQMAKHQCQQPTVIDLLVGIAIEGLATYQVNRFIVTGEATEERLSVIKQALSDIKHDWSYDLPRILEGEKFLTKNGFAKFYEVNPEGKIRLSRDPTAAMRAQFPEELPPLTYWRRKVMKANTILSWFFMPSTPQKAAKIIDASYEKLYAMAEPNFDWQQEPREPSIISNYRCLIGHLVCMPGKSYYRIHDTYLRITADKRGSQLLIALRRYKNEKGHWPESLDDIKSIAPAEIFVDPINGDSFVYKLTEENFALYSKGKNNIDEEYGADDRLIWPPKTRKTKEENADAEQQ